MRRDGIILFFAALVVYWGTWRVPEYSDPVWNTSTASSIANRGTADLTPCKDSLRAKFPQFERWMRYDGDQCYAKYTLLVPLTAAPAYFAASLLGFPENSWAVPYIGKLMACLFAAFSVLFVYRSALLLSNRRSALAAALVYAFCTSTFSVSSQALFQHGVSQFFLALSIYTLLKCREDRKAIPWLGLFLACAVWSRPLNGLAALALAACVFLRHRSGGGVRLLPGVLVVLALVAGINGWLCGRPLPQGYGEESLGWDAPFMEGLLTWLISPGRGLFFYTPVFLFSLYGIFRIWRKPGWMELRALSIAAGLYLLMAAKWHSRGGGFSYRLLVDLSVFLSLFLVPVLDSIFRRFTLSLGFYALSAISVLVQIAGVSTFFTGPPDLWRLDGGRLHAAFKTRPKLFEIILDSQVRTKNSRFDTLRKVSDWTNGVLGSFLSALVPFPLPEDVIPYCRAEAIGTSSPLRLQNVILISIDSLRADHLGCYGYPRRTSPNMDTLAATGFQFEEALSQASWTLPAHASLLTSQNPITHGVDRSNRKLSRKAETLAMWLKERGYYTGAVVSGPFMKKLYGFDRGFHEYDDELAVKEDPHSVVTSPDIYRKGMDFIKRRGDRPFFLFLHWWDVHYDYNPPPEYVRFFDKDYEGSLDASDFENNPKIHAGMPDRDRDHLIALYDGEIRMVDEYIGKLIKALGKRKLLRETLLVITADHGDEFFEHGEKGHSHSLYEELVHVPLILYSPKVAGGKSISGPVGLVDVAPTVMELLGFEMESRGIEGRSLAGLVEKGESRQEAPVWSETRRARKNKQAAARGRTARMLRLGRYKCIHYEEKGARPERYEIYDLEADPEERDPLDEASLPEAGVPSLSGMLSEWVKKNEKPPSRDQEVHLDSRTMKSLRDLGYVN